MRVLFGCTLAALVVVPTETASGMPATTTAPMATAAGAYSTVWVANFTGAKNAQPSTSTWKYDTGPGGNFGTGEIETMTNSAANIHLDGAGHLALTALRDGSGNWTSGRIETLRDNFSAPSAGRLMMSARIKLPAPTGAAGEGYWPAFWMLGATLRQNQSWPGIGEWDALEDVNGQNLAYGTLHCGTYPGGPCNESNGRGGSTSCPGSPCAGNWHTYSIVFDRRASTQYLRWSVDGHQYFQLASNQFDATTWQNATDRGNFVILDLAMGGGFPNGVAGHTTPTSATTSGGSMLIDYVKVSTSN